jgi:hypothetical protein
MQGHELATEFKYESLSTHEKKILHAPTYVYTIFFLKYWTEKFFSMYNSTLKTVRLEVHEDPKDVYLT